MWPGQASGYSPFQNWLGPYLHKGRMRKGAVIFGCQPPITLSSRLSLAFLYIQHVSWLAYQKWIYLQLSWDQDVEDSVCWLPYKRVLWLDQKHWSPKSPLDLSEGLHSCLMFGIRCITTNYFVIIIS